MGNIVWTYGGDPEHFLATSGGGAVPAHTLFRNKTKPHCYERGKVYRDGFAVELNPLPSSCRESVAISHNKLMCEVKYLASRNGLKVISRAAVRVKPEHFVRAPDDVLRFGCDSSNCAYDFVEKRPQPEQGHPYRYGGGHVHLGAYTGDLVSAWDGRRGDPSWMKNDEEAALYIRMCDRWAGIPIAFIFGDEANRKRRRLYGQAGEFRFQPYDERHFGLEYRTPPAEIWTCTPVLSYVMGVMKYIARNFSPLRRVWDDKIEPDVREAINTLTDVKPLLRYATIPGGSTVDLFEKLAKYAHTGNGRTWKAGNFGWRRFQFAKTGSSLDLI